MLCGILVEIFNVAIRPHGMHGRIFRIRFIDIYLVFFFLLCLLEIMRLTMYLKYEFCFLKYLDYLINE